MHILCPSCQNAIETEEFGSTADILCPACGSTIRLDTGSTIGWKPQDGQRTFGRFELVEALGAGAFGTVYLARDPGLDRMVAVKVPRTGDLTTAQDLDRFLREARSVAQLRHPSIVAVHEVGQAEGMPFLVSDFVRGITLADLLTGRRPTPPDSARMLATLADALQYAHEHGVVHRDVKPSNIMIDDAGAPYLMDFGLAKRDVGEVTMTVDGQILGTPAYMSPEQAAGEAHEVDGRSDVYSLGVMLYQLLTGELPFRGNTRMLLHQVRNDDPRAPRSLNDRIPRDLETICLKAMAKEPRRRYQSARDMGDDLRRFLAGEPIKARPVGRLEKAWRWARRRPAVAGLSALVVVITAVAFHLITAQWLAAEEARKREEKAKDALAIKAKDEEDARKREEKAREEADQKARDEKKAREDEAVARGRAEEAQKAEAAERRKAETGGYFLRLSLAHREWMVNNVERARQILQECPAEFRAWEWYYLWKLCNSELLTFPGDARRVAFSPDGKLLAAIGVKRTTVDGKPVSRVQVRVWDVSTGKEQRTMNVEASDVTSLTFTPDGKRLAAAVGSPRGGDGKPVGPAGFICWDPADGKELLNIASPDRLSAVTFSPDGRRFTAVTEKGKVTIRDAEVGKELSTATLDEAPVATLFLHVMTVSPDGSRVAAPTQNGVVRIWDATTGKTLTELAMQPREFSITFDVEISRDNQRVAVIDNTGIAQVYDGASGQPIRAFPAASGIMASGRVAFSPDGRCIATNASDHSLKLWDLATGRELLTLRGGGDEFGGLSELVFSPDGFRIVTVNPREVRLWDASAAQERRELPRNGGMVKGLAFGPDGQSVAVACEQALNEIGTIRINVCDLFSGQYFYIYQGHKADPVGVYFLPGGKNVLSGDEQGNIKVWELGTGKMVREIAAFPEGKINPRMRRMTVSPDGKRVAAAGVLKYQSKPGSSMRRDATVESQIKVWDLEAPGDPVVLDVKGEVEEVVLTPDGKRALAVTWTGTFRSWDLATGKELASFETEEGKIAISPDGTTLASARYRIPSQEEKDAGPTRIKVWDAATGKVVRTMTARFSDGITMTFSPDGKRLAYSGGARDRTVSVYDVDSGHETLALPGFRYAVSAMAFSPDGRRLAAGGMDPIVIVWDASDPTDVERAARRRTLEQALPGLHLREGEAALRGGQRQAAVFHFDRAVKSMPDHAVLRARRGYVHAQFGEWGLAAEDYAAAGEKGRLPLKVWFECALVQLKREDKEGYRKTCERLMQGADRVTAPDVINTLVWACAVGPDGAAEPARLIELQQKATKAAPRNYAFANTLGAALYRAGKYEEAVKQLEAAMKLTGRDGTAGDWLFLAMAQHQLGKKEAAREWLDKSQKWFERADPTRRKGGPGLQVAWEQWQELDLVRREAEALLGPAAPKP